MATVSRPRGEQRAKAYKDYFLNFTVDSKRLEPQVILVADDSKHSHRPRLTVQPFAKAANLSINSALATINPLIWPLNCVRTTREK